MDTAVKQIKTEARLENLIITRLNALDLDSSLSARKELADELVYTGNTSDSATMNI